MRKQGTKDLDFIKVQPVSVVHLDEDKPPSHWRASDVDDLAITPRSWEGAQQLPSLEHCVTGVWKLVCQADFGIPEAASTAFCPVVDGD